MSGAVQASCGCSRLSRLPHWGRGREGVLEGGAKGLEWDRPAARGAATHTSPGQGSAGHGVCGPCASEPGRNGVSIMSNSPKNAAI